MTGVSCGRDRAVEERLCLHSFQRWERIKARRAGGREDRHGATLHSSLFMMEMPQGCGKGAGLQEMAVMVQCWVGELVSSCKNYMGDQRQCQGLDECADKWCQAVGAGDPVLSYG